MKHGGRLEQAGRIHRQDSLTPAMANEAVSDPDAVIFEPDYNTNSGDSTRTIGFSTSANAVLTVITYTEDGITHGASAWKSNSRDRRYYRQGGPDE